METKKAGRKQTAKEVAQTAQPAKGIMETKQFWVVSTAVLSIVLVVLLVLLVNSAGLKQTTGLVALESQKAGETQANAQATENPENAGAAPATAAETSPKNAENQTPQESNSAFENTNGAAQETTAENPKEIETTPETPEPNETGNNPPIITKTTPEKKFDMKEGKSIEFSVEAQDPDNNALEYTWYVDRKIKGTKESKLLYDAGYGASGQHEAKVIVSDGKLETGYRWDFYVENIACTMPKDNMKIEKTTIFCEGNYTLPKGIDINASDIALDCKGATIDGNMSIYSGIRLFKKEKVTITNCNVQNYANGITLNLSNKNTIKNSTFENNRVGGMHIFDSNSNTIAGNASNRNETGIAVYYSSENEITKNTANENFGYGIKLEKATENKVSRNTVTQNRQWGIYLLGSTKNEVTDNTVQDNQIGNTYSDIASENTMGDN